MKKELSDKLYQIIPKSWLPQQWWEGFSCEDGWYQLLNELITDIKDITVDREFHIDQIKQKFGELRFYYHTGEDVSEDIFNKINDLVNSACNKSGTICEYCGEKGQLISIKGWLSVTCVKCLSNTEIK